MNGALQSIIMTPDDLDLFMARTAEVAYNRSQVSVYRNIGPLVQCSGMQRINDTHACLVGFAHVLCMKF